MAAKGILALLGARPGDEGEGGGDEKGELSPKARALRDLKRAQDDGDWEAAAEAFQRAYSICQMKGSEESEPEGTDDYEE
jgi:hypothetical protein